MEKHGDQPPDDPALNGSSASEPVRDDPLAGARDRPAHIIVCGNEKGGSGKSTIAVHLAIALLRKDCRVGTLDLDGRQHTLSRYLENRLNHVSSHGCDIPSPRHVRIERSTADARSEAEATERAELARAVEALRTACDFVVIDTPGFDTNLARASHDIADTLVTPMNDSFIDYDVLARSDPRTGETVAQSQYALQVREARRRRSAKGGKLLDWVLVRNRLSNIRSRNEQRVHESLRLLGVDLGFRLVDGVTERVIYRELFPFGLTVLDDPLQHLPELSGRGSHVGARADIERLLGNLDLPIDEGWRARDEVRQAWLERFRRVRAAPDIFAD